MEVPSLVLAETTSCDDGIRYDLICDCCGVTFAALPGVLGDPNTLWSWAERGGWLPVPFDGRLEHQCPECIRAATAVTGRARP